MSLDRLLFIVSFCLVGRTDGTLTRLIALCCALIRPSGSAFARHLRRTGCLIVSICIAIYCFAMSSALFDLQGCQ